MKNYILIIEILYALIIVLICIRIIMDTKHSGKAIAYIVTVIFLPFFGVLFYFVFGVNYRKRKIYTKKLHSDLITAEQLQTRIRSAHQTVVQNNTSKIEGFTGLANLVFSEQNFSLTERNKVGVMVNGEEKFPPVLEALQAAKDTIHLEYYIYEDDLIGNRIKEALIEKAKEGVKVRFIYDDLGSVSIRNKFIRELRQAGVEAYPFNKIRLIALANHINYRNHRKIIVIDGKIGFVGGINISDRYINNDNTKQFWRDTHLKLEGPSVLFLQYIFMCDWNFCSKQNLTVQAAHFPQNATTNSNQLVQIIATGPDSPQSLIMLSYLKAITLAKKEILITTPYFIPGESFMDALKIASLAGIQIKLLVPGKSDSRLVNAAAWSNYDDLLYAGVEIYLYQKGFVHAKTMIIDQEVSIVGTANLDFRSFDMNFEVNAIAYDQLVGQKLRENFYLDLQDSIQLIPEEFHNRPIYKQIPERIARLFSPIL